jgi:hypothetical protein
VPGLRTSQRRLEDCRDWERGSLVARNHCASSIVALTGMCLGQTTQRYPFDLADDLMQKRGFAFQGGKEGCTRRKIDPTGFHVTQKRCPTMSASTPLATNEQTCRNRR